MDFGKLGLAFTGVLAILGFVTLSLLGFLGDVITPGGAVVSGVLAVILFLGIYYVADGFFTTSDTSRRLERISRAAMNRAGPKRQTQRAEYADLYVTESTLVQSLSGFVRRSLKIEGDRLSEIQVKLLSAGFFSTRALSIYLVVKIVTPLTCLVLGIAGGYFWFGPADMSNIALTAAAGAMFGFIAPDFILKHRAKERHQALLLQIPDFIDLMLIYIESGASFDQALQKTLYRLKKRTPIAFAEFSLLERELQILPLRAQAYNNFIARADLPIVRTVVNVLQQAEKFGTPIGAAFSRLSAQSRKDRLMNAEQKAARIPILIMLPVFLFVLPSFMLAVLGPVVIKAMAVFGGV